MKIKRATETDHIESLISDAHSLKLVADRATADYKEAQELLAKEMEAAQLKSRSIQLRGMKVTATYVTRDVSNLNEAGLKKEIGAPAYNKFTKQVLDKAKLEEAMSTGAIDPMIVGKHVEVKTSKPYLRFSEKATDDE